MFNSSLKSEIWRLALLLAGCALAGGLSGHFTLLMLTGLTFCVIRLLLKISQLSRWTQATRLSRSAPKIHPGCIWSDVIYDIELLLARHEKEKQRLSTMVNRVQQMTTALNDAVILINRRGNMEWWNQAAERLFDFQDSDAGHKLTNLIRHPDFIQYFEQRDYDVPLALTLTRKQFHLEFHIHVFGDNERLVVARDSTRLYKLEQMRKDFVANVSHELRTPLTVIRGYVETLVDSPGTPPGMSKALAQMETQCDRMTVLINELLMLSRLETDQREKFDTPVSIAALVNTVIQETRPLGEKRGQQFVVVGDPDLAILGHEQELHSALSNLVINAINYSNDGSRIYIQYESNPFEAVIQVRDTGIGIDQQHLARLTERFYRVDPGRSTVSGGTGLGLAIVKHVLLRHNAELTVTSKVGQGSQFTCHFPLNVVCKTPGISG